MNQKIYFTLICLLSNLLISTLAFAQSPQAFPYQAVARNSSGNILANQLIAIRFGIIDSVINGPLVFKETHIVTTNSLGLFTVNIGQGIPFFGTFNTINWGVNAKFIQVELDPAGGNNFITMGTTQLSSVPYALYANKSNDNEWTKTGNNISNKNTGNIGIGSINTTPWKLHITGKDSAIKISGTGNIGQFGQLNFGDANWVYLREDQDDKLTINATRISLQGGNIGINTLIPAARLHVENDDVVFTAPSGLPSSPANPPIVGDGNRLMWYADKAAFRVGNIGSISGHKDSIGQYSFASGYNSQAKGQVSMACGNSAVANGLNSMALGYYSMAYGENSIAIGQVARAYGYNSISIGTDSRANGNGSIAMGYYNHANGDGAMVNGYLNVSNGCFGTVIGSFNDSIVAPQINIAPTTPLFIIGNGDWSTNLRKNAFVVRQNGRVGVGVNANTYMFEVATNSAAKPSSSAWTISSDARLKTIDGNYTKGLTDILKLNTIQYHYSKDNARRLPTDEQSYGFIAQEVQKIFPECVKENEDGYLSLDMHPILVSYVNAIKELDNKIEERNIQFDALKDQNQNLQKQIDELKEMMKNAGR
jgi:chaperonin cofactor prefoldin